AGRPRLEVDPDFRGVDHLGRDDGMHVVGTTIHRAKLPASVRAGFGDLSFDRRTLLFREDAGVFGHPSCRFQLANGVGELPPTAIHHPAAGVPWEPSAVSHPGE